MAVTPDDIQNYHIQTIKEMDKGRLPIFTAPEPPSDLGEDLTQEEKDFIKILLKDYKQRFVIPIQALGDDDVNAITDDEGNIITIEI